MPSTPISSVFNDGYVAEQLERYRQDPASVDESWRQFFRFAESIGGAAAGGAGPADAELLRITAAAAALVQAIRQYGHLDVRIDPLGGEPPSAPELTLEFHALTDADLRRIPGAALGFPERATGVEVVERLREVYSTRFGFEVWHLQAAEEREWFRQVFRDRTLLEPLGAEEKVALLRRLTEVDGLERFLDRAYKGAKRFSIEGTDALVPMLDRAIAEGAATGAREVVLAMAHRGRLNVLTQILGKPFAALFAEFEGKHAATSAESETGDVKYHMGYEGRREVDGREVAVRLIPNPSHLEVANPVLMGVARARQRTDEATGNATDRDTASANTGSAAFDARAVLPVVMHGDAAFPGEGVVPETLNMSRLRGYTVGGTLHIIVNNQVGFTTDPIDSRSTHYASDLARGFDLPVVHVNADDPEACVLAIRLAVAYRERWGKDFVVDLVGYRRHGHNETDEPEFTQPGLYAKIKAHPRPREVWARRLVADGVIAEDAVAAIEAEVMRRYEEIHGGARPQGDEHPGKGAATATETPDTTIPADRLARLNASVAAWPDGFTPHRRLATQLARRRDALAGDAVEWGHAEALAFASLLAEGVSVRLTGQDAERGTFSHRHAVLHDVETGAAHVPLAHVPEATGRFEVYNSPLTETGVLAFEYGYSVAAPDALVLWEAQFGDFVNVAQPIIDQFIVADRAKWGQDSGIVMLLPHGYEGQGPEHSSARLERFLQLAAERNLTVAYPSTSAQYFHLLRRQARQRPRRPLVVMSPKSLLRLKEAGATAAELATGAFRPVLDDAGAASRRDAVTRVVLCSGKVYYDLLAKREGAPVALVRVEQLYPWPHDAIGEVLDAYPNVREVVWAQEEPQNTGAWTFVAPRLGAAIGTRLPVRYVGRPERASPAEGYIGAHQAEQARIVAEALAPMAEAEAGGKRQKAGRA